MSMPETCPRCGEKLTPEGLLEGVCSNCLMVLDEPGSRPDRRCLGDFEIISQIGTGGMGKVYKARQISLNRIVALKVIAPHLAAQKDFVRRFDREARTLAQLNHPNIVTIHQVGVEGDSRYIAMEFIRGVDLTDLLIQRQKLDWQEAFEVAIQVLDALHAAHLLKIIHRDVKPQNIMLDHQSKVRVMDFGLAKWAEDIGSLTQPGSVVGTPNYMSPEQCRAQPIDPRSDLFSLGVVLYEVISGEKPFRGQTPDIVIHQIIHEPPPPLREVAPGVPPEVLGIIEQAIAKNPEKRFASAMEMKTALSRALAGEGIRSEAPPDTKVLASAPPNPPTALRPMSPVRSVEEEEDGPLFSRLFWIILVMAVLFVLAIAMVLTGLAWLGARSIGRVAIGPAAIPANIPQRPPPDSPTSIPFTSESLEIDGAATESSWEDVSAHALTNAIRGTNPDPEDISATWKALWDEENLYVLVQVRDDKTPVQDGPDVWEDDGVEVYIDGDLSGGARYDGANDYQFIFRPTDPVVHLGSGTRPPPYYDPEALDFEFALQSPGYAMELAVPWRVLGIRPLEGSVLGLDVHVVDDDDGGPRDAKLAWWAMVDEAYNIPGLLGQVRLSGVAGETTPVPSLLEGLEGLQNLEQMGLPTPPPTSGQGAVGPEHEPTDPAHEHRTSGEAADEGE